VFSKTDCASRCCRLSVVGARSQTSVAPAASYRPSHNSAYAPRIRYYCPRLHIVCDLEVILCINVGKAIERFGRIWRLTRSVAPSRRPKLGAVNPQKNLFSSILPQPLPSIAPPIHPQVISTPTENTVRMVAIARSFGAARVAARGFSNAGTLLRARSRCICHGNCTH
jgi:hypothetical protein